MIENPDESPTLAQWVQRAVRAQSAELPPTGEVSNPASLLPQAGGWWPGLAGVPGTGGVPAFPPGGTALPPGMGNPSGWPLPMLSPAMAIAPPGNAWFPNVPSQGIAGGVPMEAERGTPGVSPPNAVPFDGLTPGRAHAAAGEAPAPTFPSWLPNLQAGASEEHDAEDWKARVARAAGRSPLLRGWPGRDLTAGAADVAASAPAVPGAASPFSHRVAAAELPVPNQHDLGGSMGEVLRGGEVGSRAPSAADGTATARTTFPPASFTPEFSPPGLRPPFPLNAQPSAASSSLNRSPLAPPAEPARSLPKTGMPNSSVPRGDELPHSPSDWLNWTHELARDLWGVLDPPTASPGQALPPWHDALLPPPGSDSGSPASLGTQFGPTRAPGLDTSGFRHPPGVRLNGDHARGPGGLTGPSGPSGSSGSIGASGPIGPGGNGDLLAELHDLARRLADLEQAHRS